MKRWQNLDCFTRLGRHEGSNKVDGKWVLKWKRVRKEVQGKLTYIKIKGRPTAKGFKDTQAVQDGIRTYSGTATKWAQRRELLFSTTWACAVLHGHKRRLLERPYLRRDRRTNWRDFAQSSSNSQHEMHGCYDSFQTCRILIS